MKAPGIKDNFRVVVEPRRMGDFGGMSIGDGLLYANTPTDQARRERDMQDRCDEIVTSIKRHADGVAHIHIECDQEHVCSHCGASWTEASSDYNGGCCEADENAQLEREKAVQS